MLTEDGKHLYVSYDEYHNLCEKLAIKIHQSGWEAWRDKDAKKLTRLSICLLKLKLGR